MTDRTEPAATPEEAADRVVAAYAASDRATAATERAALAAFEPDNAPYGWVESHLIAAEARRIAAAPTGGWGEPLILTVPSAQPMTEAEANGPAYALATRMLALPADLYGNPHSGSTDPHHEDRMAESRAIVGIMQDAAAIHRAGTVDAPELRTMLDDLCAAADHDRAGRSALAAALWQEARTVAERCGDSPGLIVARQQAQARADRTGRDVAIYRATRTGQYLTCYPGEHETARHAFGPIVAIEQLSPQPATAYHPSATAATLAALADALTATADELASPDGETTIDAGDLYRVADAIRVTIGRPTVYDRAPAEALIAALTEQRHEAEQTAAETAYHAATLAE
jgi:hypothetical protein